MEKQRLIKYYYAVFLVIVLCAGYSNTAIGQSTIQPSISPTESTSPVIGKSSASQNINSDNSMLPLLLSILALAVSGGAIALSILKNRNIDKRIELNNEKYNNRLKSLEDKYTELLSFQPGLLANKHSEVSSREFKSYNNNNVSLEASIEALSEKVNTLENELKVAQSSNRLIDFSKKHSYNQPNDLDTNINPFNQSGGIFQPDINPLKNLAYVGLVNTYNTNPKLLEQKAIKVSEPTDSINRRHTDSSQKIILEKANNSNYWVIQDDAGIDYWLLPKSKLKIDQYRYETTKALFECNGYQAECSSFKLVKPAKVIPLSVDEQTWQLEEPGILEFSVEA